LILAFVAAFRKSRSTLNGGEMTRRQLRPQFGQVFP
jgi:hypothetical protein